MKAVAWQHAGSFSPDGENLVFDQYDRENQNPGVWVLPITGDRQPRRLSQTKVSELKDGKVSTRMIGPEDFHLPPARMEDLLVESPRHSADVIRQVLARRKGPHRDIVVLNAAAALAVADRVGSISEGLALAEQSIDSGAAAKVLDKLIAISSG